MKKDIEYKLPFSEHPFVNDTSYNITFHSVNKMNYHQFRGFILRLREGLLNVWKLKGIPPYIGKNHQQIVEDFRKLHSKDVSILFNKSNEDNYKFLIKNKSKEGRTCSQFFPSIQNVVVNNFSTWDLLSKKEFELRWLNTMVKNLKQDSILEFGKKIEKKDDIQELDKNFGFMLFKSNTKTDVTFTKNEISSLYNQGILKDYHIKNIESDLKRYKNFEIRYYNKKRTIFTTVISIIKIGFSYTPVNFEPQISKFIYEYYLPKKKKSIVYDPCSGFGGRLLGSLLSNRSIHYIGTDINSSLFEPENSYDILGKFVGDNIKKDISFHIDRISSDKMDKSNELKKFKGKVDMIFTSPPYFSKERYSDDDEQSYKKYPFYKDWVNKYLYDTFQIGFDSLKKGGLCLVNISDITINNHFLPLELDTISTLENIGFKYQYQIGMVMSKFIGLEHKNIINRWWNEENKSYNKVQPILVFKK